VSSASSLVCFQEAKSKYRYCGRETVGTWTSLSGTKSEEAVRHPGFRRHCGCTFTSLAHTMTQPEHQQNETSPPPSPPPTPMEEKTCRICLDGADPDLGRLFRPCLCKGTISVRTCTTCRLSHTHADLNDSTCMSSASNAGGRARRIAPRSFNAHSVATSTTSCAPRRSASPREYYRP
jgi:hypothetical protein